MKTVHKFKIDPNIITEGNRLVIEMPRGAQVVHVESIGEDGFLWALVDTTEPKEHRAFEVYGTGHPIVEHGALRLGFVGSFLIRYNSYTVGAPLVFHVFERSVAA